MHTSGKQINLQITFQSGLGGFTKNTFRQEAQNVYKQTLATTFENEGSGSALVNTKQISLTSIEDRVASTRRNLVASSWWLRRLNAGVTGVTFDVNMADIYDDAKQVIFATINKIASNDAAFITELKAKLKTNFEKENIAGFNATLFDSFNIAVVTTPAEVTDVVPGGVKDEGDSNVGLGVGVSVGVLFVLYMLYLCRQHQKKKERDEAQRQAPAAPANVAQGSVQKFVAGPEGTTSSLV